MGTSSSRLLSANRRGSAASTKNIIPVASGKYSFHSRLACKWPPRSYVVKRMLLMLSSSEVGCWVGRSWARRSLRSMCSKVVLPALSRPKKSILPRLFRNPTLVK